MGIFPLQRGKKVVILHQRNSKYGSYESKNNLLDDAGYVASHQLRTER